MPSTQLQTCVQHEANAVAEFAQILVEEGEALLQRALPEILAQITQRKLEMLDELQSIGQTRDALLGKLGFAAGLPGIESAAQQHPALNEAWQALNTQANAAREQNEHNGVIIRAQLQYHNEALATLRQAQAQTALYGPS